MKNYMSTHLSQVVKQVSILLLVFIIASCGSSRRSIAIEEGWELLAEQKVNFVRDKDEIDIKTGNRFTALRFKVEDREVRLNDLQITFTNGDKLEPNVDVTIPADQYSRDIELAAEGKYIDKISFTYRTTGNLLKGRANVLVFGKRYDPRLGY
jgi:hypothetical protein